MILSSGTLYRWHLWSIPNRDFPNFVVLVLNLVLVSISYFTSIDYISWNPGLFISTQRREKKNHFWSFVTSLFIWKYFLLISCAIFFFVEISYVYINMYAIFKVILLFANIKSIFFLQFMLFLNVKRNELFVQDMFFALGSGKFCFFLSRDEMRWG